MRCSPIALIAYASLALALSSGASLAQTAVSEGFRGFGSNSKDPIQIEADALEVRDRESFALFTGNVLVRQKDTTLKTARLKVLYEGRGLPGANAAPAAGESAAQAQRIRRFEAEGKVLITQTDQTVTGDQAWFDMRAQKAELTGGVVLSQGKNVARGDRLEIDLKTGQYKLDTRKGGRVQLIVVPQDSEENSAQPKSPAKP
jgi:lipopolysaccharide export system protein LptA